MIKDNLSTFDRHFRNNVVNFVNNNTTVQHLLMEDYEVEINVMPKSSGVSETVDGTSTWQQVRDYSTLTLYDIQIMRLRKTKYGL
jgi:hypothetical protein